MVFAELAAAFCIIGLGLVQKARQSQKRIIHAKNYVYTSIRGAAMGLVELHGRVSKKQLYESPLSKQPCTYCKYDIAVKQPGGYIVQKSLSVGSFLFLKDATGEVFIDAKTADFTFKPKRHYINTRKATSEEMEFLEAHNMLIVGKKIYHQKFRVREYILSSQDEIYVMGTAQDNPYVDEATQIEGYKDMMIGRGSDKDLFFIGKSDQNTVVRRLRIWVWCGFAFGPLLILIGIGLLVLAIGAPN